MKYYCCKCNAEYNNLLFLAEHIKKKCVEITPRPHQKEARKYLVIPEEKKQEIEQTEECQRGITGNTDNNKQPAGKETGFCLNQTRKDNKTKDTEAFQNGIGNGEKVITRLQLAATSKKPTTLKNTVQEIKDKIETNYLNRGENKETEEKNNLNIDIKENITNNQTKYDMPFSTEKTVQRDCQMLKSIPSIKQKICVFCRKSFLFNFQLKKHKLESCTPFLILKRKFKRNFWLKNICENCSLKFGNSIALSTHRALCCQLFKSQKKKSLSKFGIKSAQRKKCKKRESKVNEKNTKYCISKVSRKKILKIRSLKESKNNIKVLIKQKTTSIKSNSDLSPTFANTGNSETIKTDKSFKTNLICDTQKCVNDKIISKNKSGIKNAKSNHSGIENHCYDSQKTTNLQKYTDCNNESASISNSEISETNKDLKTNPANIISGNKHKLAKSEFDVSGTKIYLENLIKTTESEKWTDLKCTSSNTLKDVKTYNIPVMNYINAQKVIKDKVICKDNTKKKQKTMNACNTKSVPQKSHNSTAKPDADYYLRYRICDICYFQFHNVLALTKHKTFYCKRFNYQKRPEGSLDFKKSETSTTNNKCSKNNGAHQAPKEIPDEKKVENSVEFRSKGNRQFCDSSVHIFQKKTNTSAHSVKFCSEPKIVQKSQIVRNGNEVSQVHVDFSKPETKEVQKTYEIKPNTFDLIQRKTEKKENVLPSTVCDQYKTKFQCKADLIVHKGKFCNFDKKVTETKTMQDKRNVVDTNLSESNFKKNSSQNITNSKGKVGFKKTVDTFKKVSQDTKDNKKVIKATVATPEASECFKAKISKTAKIQKGTKTRINDDKLCYRCGSEFDHNFALSRHQSLYCRIFNIPNRNIGDKNRKMNIKRDENRNIESIDKNISLKNRSNSSERSENTAKTCKEDSIKEGSRQTDQKSMITRDHSGKKTAKKSISNSGKIVTENYNKTTDVNSEKLSMSDKISQNMPEKANLKLNLTEQMDKTEKLNMHRKSETNSNNKIETTDKVIREEKTGEKSRKFTEKSEIGQETLCTTKIKLDQKVFEIVNVNNVNSKNYKSKNLNKNEFKTKSAEVSSNKDDSNTGEMICDISDTPCVQPKVSDSTTSNDNVFYTGSNYEEDRKRENQNNKIFKMVLETADIKIDQEMSNQTNPAILNNIQPNKTTKVTLVNITKSANDKLDKMATKSVGYDNINTGFTAVPLDFSEEITAKESNIQKNEPLYDTKSGMKTDTVTNLDKDPSKKRYFITKDVKKTAKLPITAPETEPAEDNNTCKVCGYQFENLFALERHLYLYCKAFNISNVKSGNKVLEVKNNRTKLDKKPSDSKNGNKIETKNVNSRKERKSQNDLNKHQINSREKTCQKEYVLGSPKKDKVDKDTEGKQNLPKQRIIFDLRNILQKKSDLRVKIESQKPVDCKNFTIATPAVINKDSRSSSVIHPTATRVYNKVATFESIKGQKLKIFCEKCGTIIYNVNDLDNPPCGHERTFFHCFVCKTDLPDINSLISHQDHRHKAGEILIKETEEKRNNPICLYYCCHCGEGFKILTELVGHKANQHQFYQKSNIIPAPIIRPDQQEEKTYACVFCNNQPFKSLDLLLKHEETSDYHKQNERKFSNFRSNYAPILTKSFEHVCYICNLGFRSFKNQQIHMLTSYKHYHLENKLLKNTHKPENVKLHNSMKTIDPEMHLEPRKIATKQHHYPFFPSTSYAPFPPQAYPIYPRKMINPPSQYFSVVQNARIYNQSLPSQDHYYIPEQCYSSSHPQLTVLKKSSEYSRVKCPRIDDYYSKTVPIHIPDTANKITSSKPEKKYSTPKSIEKSDLYKKIVGALNPDLQVTLSTTSVKTNLVYSHRSNATSQLPTLSQEITETTARTTALGIKTSISSINSSIVEVSPSKNLTSASTPDYQVAYTVPSVHSTSSKPILVSELEKPFLRYYDIQKHAVLSYNEFEAAERKKFQKNKNKNSRDAKFDTLDLHTDTRISSDDEIPFVEVHKCYVCDESFGKLRELDNHDCSGPF